MANYTYAPIPLALEALAKLRTPFDGNPGHSG